MKPFLEHTGRAAPLPQENIDTDQIIPSDFLKRISRTGFEDGLFAEWRKDPDFVLNKPQFQGVSLLIAGENFGCGSSREHAVWALQDFGIRVVVSSSFADIFRGNAGNAGLLLAEVSRATTDKIWDALDMNPQVELTVDLEDCVIRFDASVAPFTIDEHTRQKLLLGLDDIEVSLSHQEDIEKFEALRPRWRPSIESGISKGPTQS
jgi:3-isopropylmalate/(R)-2-methylmalate dehydratase small subunit